MKSAISFLITLIFGPKGSRNTVFQKQGWGRNCKLIQEEWAHESMGITRLIRLLILIGNFARPQVIMDTVLDLIFQKRKRAEVAVFREAYYLTRLTFFLLSLLYWHRSPIVIWLILILLYDMLLNHAGGVLVWGRYSIDPQRSLILCLINYAEVTVAFAILYLHYECLSVKSPSPLQALYFSAIIATTLGFGDLLPKNSNSVNPNSPVSSIALTLVLIQLAVFVLFALLIVNTLLSRQRPEERKLNG